MVTQTVGSSGSVTPRLIEVLRQEGPQTIEALSTRAGISWTQVFLAIDRLSRSGGVSLRRLGGSRYQVSLNRTSV